MLDTSHPRRRVQTRDRDSRSEAWARDLNLTPGGSRLYLASGLAVVGELRPRSSRRTDLKPHVSGLSLARSGMQMLLRDEKWRDAW